MSKVRGYEVTTDYGVMRFTSEDVVGYWWELITGENEMELQPHQQRVVDEKTELDTKLQALGKFIADNPIYAGLSVDERQRLRRQYDAMTQYSGILGERIRAFSAA